MFLEARQAGYQVNVIPALDIVKLTISAFGVSFPTLMDNKNLPRALQVQTRDPGSLASCFTQ